MFSLATPQQNESYLKLFLVKDHLTFVWERFCIIHFLIKKCLQYLRILTCHFRHIDRNKITLSLYHTIFISLS